MAGSDKNAVERQAPLFNRMKPAALISDALYCSKVYDAPQRYARDMGILTVMSLLMIGGAFLIVRRERYDSI